MVADPPLACLQVVDLARGDAGYVARLLEEMGAKVWRPENAGDPAKVWDEVIVLAENADLMIAGRDVFPDVAAAKDFARRHPELVILVISDFGLGNSFSDWKGGEAICQALGGQLSRSGIPGREPLLAPGGIATHSAFTQAVLLALLAYLAQQAGHGGQVIDFSVIEGAAQALDPGFGIQGSATSGIPASKLPRGRPEARFQYPIVECRDGFARVCVLSPRQWQGMFEWLGRPKAFEDPSFANLIVRYRSPDLLTAIAKLFADKTRAEIEREAVRFGVPAAGLATLEEAIENDHFTARSTLVSIPDADGLKIRKVATPIEIDGLKGGRETASPPTDWIERKSSRQASVVTASGLRPLEGLRVLDLGVIVVGAEAGRLLADFGADVIKVENPKFPDGARQTKKGDVISPGFAAGHRNKRSLAIDLRSAEGRKLMLALAREADVVLSNFKPGTMESLGIGYEELLAANPRLAIVESSAFGSSGPWSERGGYGPLVRAAAGLTYLWRYDDDPLGFSDALTVYPDHAAGRMSAIAAIALLIRRQRTGRGGRSSIAQVEVMLSHLENCIQAIGREPASKVEQYVVPCSGEDEWCVVETTTVEEQARLRELLELRDDVASGDVRLALVDLCKGLGPLEAAEYLQARGIAAAPMLRVSEMKRFPFFMERSFLQPLIHAHLDAEYVMERAPVSLSKFALAPDRPAPLMGEHSREIARDILGLEEDVVDRLFSDSILFEPSSDA